LNNDSTWQKEKASRQAERPNLATNFSIESFVSGHDLSHAEITKNIEGFSPCAMILLHETMPVGSLSLSVSREALPHHISTPKPE
jgi:hypothetical protein